MATTYLNGTEVHTVGELPVVGSFAPDFTLTAPDLSEITLSKLQGNKVVLNIFPSLDTEVCALSVVRFNKDAASYPDTKVICVSKDLPFAASKFTALNDIKNVEIGSGFRSDFGTKYGVEIADGPLKGLYARAIVVIDTDGRVLATSLTDEITHEPDYDMVKKVLASN